MIEVKGFEGHKPEIELVGYFLKNAKVLKKVLISSRNMHYGEESTALKKLIKFPRLSKSCELVFY